MYELVLEEGTIRRTLLFGHRVDDIVEGFSNVGKNVGQRSVNSVWKSGHETGKKPATEPDLNR